MNRSRRQLKKTQLEATFEVGDVQRTLIEEAVKRAVVRQVSEDAENTIQDEAKAMEARLEDRMREYSGRVELAFEKRLRDIKTEQFDTSGSSGFGQDRVDTQFNLISPKDTQPGKLQPKASKADFTLWRRCVEQLVDSSNGWKGGSLLLEKLRIEREEITRTTFNKLTQENIAKDEDNLIEHMEWDFTTKTR